MSYEYGDSINKKGIKKEDFNNALNEKHLNEKEKKATMDIFSKFASLNGDENLLDESEQIQARSAFAALDKNQDKKVTKKELKHSPDSNELSKTYSDSGEKISETFMNTLDITVNKGDKSNIGQVQYGENKPTAYYQTQAPRLPQDEGLTTYHTDNDGRIIEKDNITLNGTYVYTGDKDNKYKIDNKPEQKLVNKKEVPLKEIKPVIPVVSTETDVKSTFFQYLSNDKTFTGKLKNGKDMELPSGCELIKNGETFAIKLGDNIYNMRGKSDDTQNPLRFECDETKKTLQEALSETKSDDAVHNYHNHGINGNQKSTYDKQTGVISHGTSESAVGQTQTFASMLMNGNEDSTLKLDKQKGPKGETETTGEIILKTINVNDDNGIDMTELVSYLKADQEESKTVKNRSGARKFAGGVDLDAKDLANIGKAFKKYDTNKDGKLNKVELQKLLDDLKQNSMSKIAGKENDKYIGDAKPTEDKPLKTKSEEDTKPEPTPLEGNRKRHIKENSQEVGNGQKEEYFYKKGLRTKIENGTINDTPITFADEDSNIAVIKNPLLGKKKFLDIKGLEQNVDARIKKYTVDDNEDTQIIKVKDKNDTIKYYLLNTNPDGTYQLGEELTDKGENKFLTKNSLAKKINTKFGFNDAKIPKEITAKYDSKGNMNIYLNNGPCSENVAKIYIIRYNAQLAKDITKKDTSIQNSPAEIAMKSYYYYTPTKLKEKEQTVVAKKATDFGLTKTWGETFGWYKDSKNIHYKWNHNTKTFDKFQNITLVDEYGRASFGIEDLNDPEIYKAAATGNTNMIYNLGLHSSTSNVNDIIKNFNKEKKEKGFFESIYNASQYYTKSSIIDFLASATENKLTQDNDFKELYQIFKTEIDNGKYQNLSSDTLKQIDTLTEKLNEKIQTKLHPSN